MTASERVGQQLPELLEELALPRVPDYFDDLLRTTAATRQQPSWASLERWFPVASVTRPAPFGLPSWQPILLVAALLLAATIGGILIVGSQQRVPAPFGPAQNGVLLASTLDGRLVSIDPANATATDLGGTPGRFYPWYSPDGSRMLYVTKDENGFVNGLFIANADGSEARRLLSDASKLGWVEWSPSGDRVLALEDPVPPQRAWLFDTTTGEDLGLDFAGMRVSEAYFRPNGELVFKGETPFPNTTWAYYVTGLDAPDPRPLIEPQGTEVFGGTLSPDGSTWVYSKWDTPKGIAGKLYTVDVETGTERPLDVAGYGPGVADLNPVWSPDGSLLLVRRFVDRIASDVIVRADGTGEAIVLTGGPSLRTQDDPERLFSPDGHYVVLRYPADNSAWIYSTADGAGHEVEGAALDGLTWQRQAP